VPARPARGRSARLSDRGAVRPRERLGVCCQIDFLTGWKTGRSASTPATMTVWDVFPTTTTAAKCPIKPEAVHSNEVRTREINPAVLVRDQGRLHEIRGRRDLIARFLLDLLGSQTRSGWSIEPRAYPVRAFLPTRALALELVPAQIKSVSRPAG